MTTDPDDREELTAWKVRQTPGAVALIFEAAAELSSTGVTPGSQISFVFLASDARAIATALLDASDLAAEE